MRFIAVAASSMTGRSCWRYTVSVTVVVRCPTSFMHSQWPAWPATPDWP